MSRSRELLAALQNADAGGLLARPPGLDGEPTLGLAGIHGVPRGRTWDAVVSASASRLTGDSVSFVVLDDGTVVVDGDQPDDSLAPLADAVEQILAPPYRAAAIRKEGAVWAAVAERTAIAELPGVDGEEVELTLVGGQRDLTIDGQRTIRPLPALDRLAEEHGDVVVRAERIDGDLFAADVFPL